MKKIWVIGFALLIILLAAGPALAWHRYFHPGFGVFITPPIVLAPPPMVFYHGYYPPYGYHAYDYPDRYRAWIPGYWDRRWTPYGWQRLWIPGHWQWR